MINKNIRTDKRVDETLARHFVLDLDSGKAMHVEYKLIPNNVNGFDSEVEVSVFGEMMVTYKNAERNPDSNPIKNQKVLEALKELPKIVQDCIEDLHEKKQDISFRLVCDGPKGKYYRQVFKADFRPEDNGSSLGIVWADYRRQLRKKAGENLETNIKIENKESFKVYLNGELMPGMKPIENQRLLDALRTLPDHVSKHIPELWSRK